MIENNPNEIEHKTSIAMNYIESYINLYTKLNNVLYHDNIIIILDRTYLQKTEKYILSLIDSYSKLNNQNTKFILSILKKIKHCQYNYNNIIELFNSIIKMNNKSYSELFFELLAYYSFFTQIYLKISKLEEK